MRDRRLPYVNSESFSAGEMGGTAKDWTPRAKVRTATSSQNVRIKDGLVRVDATGGDVTLTLESAIICRGRIHHFKKVDASANSMIIATSLGQTIDGQSTIEADTQYHVVSVVSNGTNWELIEHGAHAVGGGEGGGELIWARFKADGTVIASNDVTVEREGEGTYLCTSAIEFEEVGGFFQYGIVVTPSSVAGNGGDGVSPLNAFDSFEVCDTDDFSAPNWFYNESNDKIYLLGPTTDDAWVHNFSTNFTSAATQVAFSSTIRSSSLQMGVLSSDGLRLWKSGDSSVPVEMMATSNNAVTTFGNLDIVILAADATNIYGLEGGVLKKYTPNVGGASLGASVASWAFDPGVSIGTWDTEGYLWFSTGSAGLYMADPAGSDFTEFNFPEIPEEVSTVSSGSRPIYDRNRNKIYVTLNASSSQHYLYEFSGWQFGVNHSGTWQRIAILPDGSTGISYDPVSDILLTCNTGLLTVTRWTGNPMRPVDTVSVDDTTPDNDQVDYDLTSTWFSFYSDGYAVVSGAKGANHFLIKISYNGDPLGFGGGGGAVSSVLVPLYEIISATEAYVYLFRSLSPPVFADGECTVHFVRTEGGGAGGGATNATDLQMSTNRLLGRTTAGAGAVEEITVTANNGLLFASTALSIDRALQTDMETPTTGNKIVASTAMIYHPGVFKAFCSFDATGSLLGPFYNIGSITDNGTGDWTVNISGSFPLSSANGTILLSVDDATPAVAAVVDRVSASAYQIKCWDLAGNLVDPDRINFAILGDCS